LAAVFKFVSAPSNWSVFGVVRTPGDPAELLGRTDCLHRPGYDLLGPGAERIVGQTVLEQLGVREDDAELVVQPVEKTNHLGWQRGVLRPAARQRRVRRHG